MSDILISTTKEKLLHKQGRLKGDEDYSQSGWYFWKLFNTPKRLVVGDKIWFAVNTEIMGYFVVSEIDSSEFCSIIFRCDSWCDVPGGVCKRFQGFKYWPS